jgi:hypothetical protein
VTPGIRPSISSGLPHDRPRIRKKEDMVDANSEMIKAVRGLPDEQLDEMVAAEMAKWGK